MTAFPRVAVIQFPGVNCEAETLRALERVGLVAEVFRWTRPAGELRDFQAYVLPGGFSYQDRVRAGALAAKDPLVEVLHGELERGKPALGICNGAQVLVEAGLIPGGSGVDLGAVPRQMVGPWPEARSRAFDDGAGGAEAVDDVGPGLRLFEGLRRHLVEV